MKTYLIMILGLGLFFIAGMSPISAQDSSISDIAEKDRRVIEWLEQMSQPGVSMEDDSLLINDESKRLLTDPAYRAEMYPDKYTWEQALNYISRQKLPQAFWYFLNLYRTSDENKELVLRSVLTYDKVLQMDKVLVSTFYTYIYMDLETSQFIDGQPVVFAPDVMEDKLNSLKDILYIIGKFRESNASGDTQG